MNATERGSRPIEQELHALVTLLPHLDATRSPLLAEKVKVCIPAIQDLVAGFRDNGEEPIVSQPFLREVRHIKGDLLRAAS